MVGDGGRWWCTLFTIASGQMEAAPISEVSG